MIVARRYVIVGRVQGVGYRAFVEDEARARGLDGWVRNRRDGTVESVLKGEAEMVADMIKACQRGPFSAHVSALDQREGTEADLAARSGVGFSVLPTV